tara:strand:+ start:1334 stop:1525 length:192 start_codon:yes stop_codon:yes gene_type:complete
MIYLEASDDLCLARIARRAEEQPERTAFGTPEVFRHVTQYFEEPGRDEWKRGLSISGFSRMWR